MNTAILFVPQQEAWVVERMGKFHQILKPGFNFLIPIIDKISYVQSLKEIAIDVPQQSAITLGKYWVNYWVSTCQVIQFFQFIRIKSGLSRGLIAKINF